MALSCVLGDSGTILWYLHYEPGRWVYWAECNFINNRLNRWQKMNIHGIKLCKVYAVKKNTSLRWTKRWLNALLELNRSWIQCIVVLAHRLYGDAILYVSINILILLKQILPRFTWNNCILSNYKHNSIFWVKHITNIQTYLSKIPVC